MVATENIVGAIIVVLVLMVVGVVATTTFLEKNKDPVQIQNRDHQLDLYDTNWATLLAVNEKETGKTFEFLISKSLSEMNEMITVDGIEINVSEKLAEVLDVMYGVDNYFITVSPVIDSVYFRFILDSSGSFAEERAAIAAGLDTIYNSINDMVEEDVIFYIYALPTTSGDPLEDFTATNNIIPKQLTREELESVAIPQPELEHMTERGQGIFLKSDWIPAIKYASVAFEDEVAINRIISVNFILPLVDEPSTSAMSTLTLKQEDIDRTAVVGLCDVENGICQQRAQEQMNALIAEGLTLYDRVIPLKSIECNYRYYDYWNTINDYWVIHDYSDHNQRPWDDPAADSWCEFNNCPGCRQIGSGETDYCFHEECTQTINNHAQQLADMTSGTVLDITQISDLATEIGDITTEMLEDAKIEFGNRELVNKYVYEKKIFLQSGKQTKIRLEVAEKDE